MSDHRPTVKPEVALFHPLGSSVNLTVLNSGPIRYAVKIRCSGNKIYRIVPSGFFLEPGEETTVHVLRRPNHVPRTDKLVFCFVDCGEDAENVNAIVTAADANTINVRVLLRVEKVEGLEYKDFVSGHCPCGQLSRDSD